MSYKGSEIMEYGWKHGYVAKVPAEVAANRIAFLSTEMANGIVTPKMVVDDARPEEALLHPAFEWQDDVAAELYREQQARDMLRSITVKVQVAEDEERIIRAFENVKIPVISDQTPIKLQVNVGDDVEDGIENNIGYVSGYKNTLTALQDNTYRRQIMERAAREIQAYIKKYRAYKEICREFDEAIELFEAGRVHLMAAIQTEEEGQRV